MTQNELLKYSYLAYLSQPASDRPIYRAIRRYRVRRIVELGVGYAKRAQRMIALASQCQPDGCIWYTGIDLFEDRPADRPGITLKLAYQLLRRSAANVQVRLVPGDPFEALARTANSLTNTDLIVISQDQDLESLTHAWSLVPRMLHETTLVFQEHEAAGGKLQLVCLPLDHIEHLAGTLPWRTRMAA